MESVELVAEPVTLLHKSTTHSSVWQDGYSVGTPMRPVEATYTKIEILVQLECRWCRGYSCTTCVPLPFANWLRYC